ncbi:MAG: sigma-70 family RNA polymerase sigma factor [Acidobacteriota bacterium]
MGESNNEMAASASERISQIVSDLDGGAEEGRSLEDLFELLYPELRRLAGSFMAGERKEHTLQPTALVHEVYVRLVNQAQIGWRGRGHFFAVGARIMRHILVDHARVRGREKRGGAWRRVTLSEAIVPAMEDGLEQDELLALDQALERLAAVDQREAHVVELRFFAGLTVPEIADLVGVSRRTVETDWAHARAWLLRELATGKTG